MLGGLLGGMMGGMGGGGMMGGGGPLGMLGMDFGLHKMPIIGGFFQDPNEIFKQQQFQQAGAAYQNYRPELEQARMNALRQQMSAFGGANNALGTMYGGGNSFDSGQLEQSPLGPSMLSHGGPKGPDMTGKLGPQGPLQGIGNFLPGMGGGFPGMGGMLGGPMGLFGG